MRTKYYYTFSEISFSNFHFISLEQGHARKIDYRQSWNQNVCRDLLRHRLFHLYPVADIENNERFTKYPAMILASNLVTSRRNIFWSSHIVGKSGTVGRLATQERSIAVIRFKVMLQLYDDRLAFTMNVSADGENIEVWKKEEELVKRRQVNLKRVWKLFNWRFQR